MVSSIGFYVASLAIAAAPDGWQVQLHAIFAGTSSFLSLVCGSSRYVRDIGVSFVAAICSATWDFISGGCQWCWAGIGACCQSAYGACVCWGRGADVDRMSDADERDLLRGTGSVYDLISSMFLLSLCARSTSLCQGLQRVS